MLFVFCFRVQQADLTLLVVDSTLLPSEEHQASALLLNHLRSVLSSQENTETGISLGPHEGII